MKELTEQSATALPLPYGALFIHETQNMALAEEIAHDTLDRYRINPYREFFEVDLPNARKASGFSPRSKARTLKAS